MQDTGDWDDLQAAELEACGVLTDMFGQDIPNEGECSVVHNVNIIEDSPQPEKNQTFLEVDSSTGGEDEDDIFGSKMGRKSICYIPDQSSTPGNSSTQLLARHSLESMIWLGIGPCNCMDQIRGLKNVSLLYRVGRSVKQLWTPEEATIVTGQIPGVWPQWSSCLGG
ncbi:uncharacterized protein LOC115667673 [Syzygium oleosum]|uniref:uncharacterized protein LOC115667673 n=1 Tax=Syzygium oleosum TaxID=219896 RepID=UPI0024B96AE0|nr:uncharacterized protein LOC115667673 [Syzygium oleosum]